MLVLRGLSSDGVVANAVDDSILQLPLPPGTLDNLGMMCLVIAAALFHDGGHKASQILLIKRHSSKAPSVVDTP